MMQKAMAANGAMAFLELYLEDDCTNLSGNKVMDIQHKMKGEGFYAISAF